MHSSAFISLTGSISTGHSFAQIPQLLHGLTNRIRKREIRLNIEKIAPSGHKRRQKPLLKTTARKIIPSKMTIRIEKPTLSPEVTPIILQGIADSRVPVGQKWQKVELECGKKKGIRKTDRTKTRYLV